MYTDDYTDPDRQLPVSSWAAKVANEVEQAGDDLYVTIPGIDTGIKNWGPCRWAPQITDAGAVAYPSTDDDALVIKDNEGEYWVVMWWPYA